LDSSPAVLTTSASCRAKSSTRWSSSRWRAAAGSGVRRSSAKPGCLGPRRGVVNEPGVRCWLPDSIRRSPLLSARRREHTAAMRLDYGRDEILAEHGYERPLVLDGVPCHGGFVDGRYVSPRTLFEAHARDEAGHRRMWELARDIALDRPSIPPDLTPNLTPAAAPRLLPEIPGDMEALVLRMVGVLVVEVFAAEAFRWARETLGDAALFRRHDEVRTLIGFIQQDEAPHVGYLATALAELRCRRLGGEGGEPLPGRDLIDRARDTIVGFQAGPRQRANVAFRTQVIERCVADHPRREALLGELRAVG